jgi:hypothetical protein
MRRAGVAHLMRRAAVALGDLAAALDDLAACLVPPDFACLDCGTNVVRLGEYFMVWDDVWLRANPDDRGMLCIGCLEQRLGRQLYPLDFADAPVNFDHVGPRLRSRIFR